jgi:hypothetical protein
MAYMAISEPASSPTLRRFRPRDSLQLVRPNRYGKSEAMPKRRIGGITQPSNWLELGGINGPGLRQYIFAYMNVFDESKQ